MNNKLCGGYMVNIYYENGKMDDCPPLQICVEAIEVWQAEEIALKLYPNATSAIVVQSCLMAVHTGQG